MRFLVSWPFSQKFYANSSTTLSIRAFKSIGQFPLYFSILFESAGVGADDELDDEDDVPDDAPTNLNRDVDDIEREFSR